LVVDAAANRKRKMLEQKAIAKDLNGPLATMDFRQLLFLQAAEFAGGYRPAEDIFRGDVSKLSEGTLSVQIRALEASIGVELFTASGRGRKLTYAGEIFLRDIQQIIEQTKNAISNAQDVQLSNKERLKVGFTPSAVYGPMPILLRSYRNMYTNVEVILEEIHTTNQGQALRDRTIDVGFARSPEYDRSLAGLLLREEDFRVVLPETHHLAKQESIELSDLSDQDIIMLSQSASPSLFGLVMYIFMKAEIEPRVKQITNHIQTMVALVAQGWGVALVPESVEALQIPGARYLPLVTDTQSTLELKWWRYSNPSAVPRTLADFIELTRQWKEKERHS
jgi:DNA-binding transcriptional LysR family regulator